MSFTICNAMWNVKNVVAISGEVAYVVMSDGQRLTVSLPSLEPEDREKILREVNAQAITTNAAGRMPEGEIEIAASGEKLFKGGDINGRQSTVACDDFTRERQRGSESKESLSGRSSDQTVRGMGGPTRSSQRGTLTDGPISDRTQERGDSLPGIENVRRSESYQGGGQQSFSRQSVDTDCQIEVLPEAAQDEPSAQTVGSAATTQQSNLGGSSGVAQSGRVPGDGRVAGSNPCRRETATESNEQEEPLKEKPNTIAEDIFETAVAMNKVAAEAYKEPMSVDVTLNVKDREPQKRTRTVRPRDPEAEAIATITQAEMRRNERINQAKSTYDDKVSGAEDKFKKAMQDVLSGLDDVTRARVGKWVELRYGQP